MGKRRLGGTIRAGREGRKERAGEQGLLPTTKLMIAIS
jgi:hypothetical protein